MIRLFRVSVPNSILVAMLLDFLVLTLCFTVPAQWTQDLPLDLYLSDDGGWQTIGLIVLVIMIGLYMGDLYDNFRKQSTVLIVQQLITILGVSLLIQSILTYLRSPWIASKWLMLYGGVALVIVFPAWRRMFTTFVQRRLDANKVLLVGSSSVVRKIVKEALDRPELGIAPAGYVDDERDPELEQMDIPYLGKLKDLERRIVEMQPERLIVGVAGESENFPVGSLLDQQFSGLRIERSATTYEAILGRVALDSLHAEDLIFSSELGPNRATVVLQNVYSWVFGLIGMLLSLPVMAVVAILVKATSPGPVLFRQVRVGKKKRPFTLYKFRSMRADAEAKTGAVWATKNDPRITPIGGVLRNLRLDELPQFFNVLRGDMLLVGPRPERPEFVEMLEDKIPYYRHRMSVKPGITGWAQINYKYGETLEDTKIKLEFDLYYIKHLASSLDAYIIFHTVKVMLLSRGAQ